MTTTKRFIKYFIFLLFLSSWTIAKAQILEPVKWIFSAKALEEGVYQLEFHAQIDAHWHLYSQNIEPDVGPIPTHFVFEKGNYQLLGKVIEPKPIVEYDPNFDMNLGYFENQPIFRQKVKAKPGTIVKGRIDFMACDQEKCIFPDPALFEIKLEQSAKKEEAPEKANSKEKNLKPSDDKSIEIKALNLPQTQKKETQASGIENPVSVDIVGIYKQQDSKKFTIEYKALIGKGWHIYSSKPITSDGPLATVVNIDSIIAMKLGPIQEPKPIKKYDPNFDMDLEYFENEVLFRQQFEVENLPAYLSGSFEYMACNQEKCLTPVQVPFNFRIEKEGTLVSTIVDPSTPALNSNTNPFEFYKESIAKAEIIPCGDVVVQNIGKESNLLKLFFLGFIGGLIALLTPCVFPMIPLTVSFFTKSQNQSRSKGIKDASLYGLFIFLVYILLSLPFHIFDQIDENILNSISTNMYLNTFFFVIFIVFAISFFGYFEISLPAKWTNKADSASDIGGVLGIFFMALTLGLVSFSCTGPILGSLLAGSLSSTGGAMQLTAGMGGFGFALALPFALFAAFPSWLNGLPKSGGWLNSVKVVLGFVELALALKFLSNADLVAHWGIIKIEVFLGIWILIGIGLSLYLLGKIKFPHDSPIKKLSPVRWGLAATTIAFTIYLSTGFVYDKNIGGFGSLKFLSGMAPPAGYSFIHPIHCPMNLNCFHDYQTGMQYAKEAGKPVILDFTGYACVNCRKMEENVWDQKEVFDVIKNDYVLISLYVDDDESLPIEEQTTFTTAQGRVKTIETVGDKWATFQTETFVNNSQPYYALVDPNETLLNQPVGYTPNVKEFADFLQCGLNHFHNKNK